MICLDSKDWGQYQPSAAPTGLLAGQDEGPASPPLVMQHRMAVMQPLSAQRVGALLAASLTLSKMKSSC